MTTATIERLPLDETFAVNATPDAIERAATALRGHGFEVEIVPTGDAARDLVLSRIPLGAEVHGGASLTIDTIGLSEVLERSGDYQAVRPRLWSMDRATQGDEIRKLGAAPDVFVNSAVAVTEDGALVSASASGSQLGPIASGAGHVYFVIGAQKVVPDVATALRRLETYAFPLEDARALEAYGFHSALNKILILNGERPGRITIVLVQEAIGF
jgi:LUD domain